MNALGCEGCGCSSVAAGMERARAVLASGHAAIAAYLLDEPIEAFERVGGRQSASMKPWHHDLGAAH